MRRRNLILVLSAGLVVAAAVTVPFLLRARATEWTTKSPAALAAFEAGLDARMRFYLLDAALDFRQALALDPSFAARASCSEARSGNVTGSVAGPAASASAWRKSAAASSR